MENQKQSIYKFDETDRSSLLRSLENKKKYTELQKERRKLTDENVASLL
jgi:hypothetical protein